MPITIQFGTNITFDATQPVGQQYHCDHCISEFSLYWGSIDSWNKITFTDVAGGTVSFWGSDLNVLTPLGQNDIASYVYDFLNSQSGTTLAWQSVSFSSTSAAFEFDNISWVDANCAYIIVGPCPTAPISFSSPATATPEPSSMTLLFTGVLGIVGALKRRL